MGTALFAFAVVPFGATTVPPPPGTPDYVQRLDDYNHTYQFVIAPRVDVGIVFVFAVGSLAVYGIVLGGWSSNSKYSLLGSLRSSAQLVSYEIPMGMSVLGIILMTGSLNLEQVIQPQTVGPWGVGGWNIWYQPLAFLLFLTSVFAECNRMPFDLPEAEQELVGGYHTEYSAMKFAQFFLGEYTHMVTTSFLVVTLFFGGWHLPGLEGTGLTVVVLKLVVFVAKMSFFIWVSMWVRWTIPRFRFDQLMGMAWKVFLPLALLNLVCVLTFLELRKDVPLSRWWLTAASVVLFVGAGLVAGYWPQEPQRRRIPRAAALSGDALVGEAASR
jgi:NADH-quinone oxidoreductase subunit H